MSPIASQSWLRNVGIPLLVIGGVAGLGGAGVAALVSREDAGVHRAWSQREAWLVAMLEETRADLGAGTTTPALTREIGRRLEEGPHPSGMPSDVRIAVNEKAGVILFGQGTAKCRSLQVASGEVTHC